MSSIPSGAKVFLDDSETEWKTPAKLNHLSAGVHTIRLEKGELIGSKRIFVLPDVTGNVEIGLRRGYGSVYLKSGVHEVTCDPPGGLEPLKKNEVADGADVVARSARPLLIF